MTNERKNEIWAMLTQEEKRWLTALYKTNNRNSHYCNGFNDVLKLLFGSHNLTAQAEEKPKEDVKNPPLKITAADSLIQMAKEEMGIIEPAEQKPKEPLCSVDSKNYNNGNHIVGRENNIDYAQYRLDLAKEIAVAMITANSARYDVVGHHAVYTANEIVKRLKETEI